jgi:hypothetical protein
MKIQHLLYSVATVSLLASACTDSTSSGGGDAGPAGPGNIRDAMPSLGGNEVPLGGNGSGGNGSGGNGTGGNGTGGNGSGGNGSGGFGGKPDGGEPGTGGQVQGGEPGTGGQVQGGEPGTGGQVQGGEPGTGGTGGQAGSPCDQVVCDFGEICDDRTGRCVPNVQDPCADVVCEANEHCEEGICIPDQVDPGQGIAHGCTGPEECPEGFCLDEVANPDFPGGFCVVECGSDADCGGGLCAQVDVDFALCLAACGRPEDCREGWACIDDPAAPSAYCVPDCRVTGCGPGGVCNEQTGACDGGAAGCTVDADCAAGQLCDAANGQCVDVGGECRRNADCSIGEICNVGTGICEAAGCTVDIDCARDEFCNQRTGVCELLVECQVDGDCGFGEICDAGVCTADPNLCQVDADCPAGELCDFATGQCVADGGFCSIDADCPAGEVCNPRLGVCQAENPAAAGRYDPCNAPEDCGVDLVCVQFAPGENYCLGLCDASAAIDGCLPREGCYAPDQALPNEAFCIPGNDCAAGTATDTCGAPASCFSLGHATLCVSPGNAGVGEPCDPLDPAGENCQENLVCEFGLCREACNANGTCDAGQCIDISAQVDDVPYSFCVATCNVFDQSGCGAGEACAVSGVNAGAVFGECVGVPGGNLAGGDACTEDQATYWGDCEAGYLCGALFQGDPTSCIGFCDATDASLCGGNSACLPGLFDAPYQELGLCVGDCDVFGGAGCARGTTCTFSGRFGLTSGGVEGAIGFCAPGNGSLSVGDACVPDQNTGGSDCEVGSICIDVDGSGATVCTAVCEDAAGSPNTCPAGLVCATGLGADPIGLGGSERIGLCIAAP